MSQSIIKLYIIPIDDAKSRSCAAQSAVEIDLRYRITIYRQCLGQNAVTIHHIDSKSIDTIPNLLEAI
jgi:hypothetical protein